LYLLALRERALRKFHTLLKKSEYLVRVTRLRASPRHGGARRFTLFFLVPDPPRGSPVGGGCIYRKYGGMGVSTPIIVIELYNFREESQEIIPDVIARLQSLPPLPAIRAAFEF
jgi:hypothetical protein